ncbi:ammonia-forming cytochrome c nitrite reductase subunit c552 [Shewanella inventionis]|uniref:nitrite reductase (cytochrome; ammonia-forming) n=1 Tax=Shewanella inventionis TaxID=1738770 RepID=A0ABQ1J9H4_9GAMM|nr:ammonia-forming cytochrome c nitrite reductase subunit c552 [Shewanella inventionis]MCL1158678.1 ammonia-forming cytochrome c nitrite reductase subunit c552 [Shewanella inventionis]UAL42828.1 ammonia-forming cytochrome c nitrite reductase subunit c552 [Shewanella inventionis]GGB61517.1 cytochrome c-552 [Shewanella inventionis]
MINLLVDVMMKVSRPLRSKTGITILVAGLALLTLTSWSLQSEELDPNQIKFPNQFASWEATVEQDESEDMLAQYPASIILWAGSSFAKEYHSPRGHQFAVADVTHTLRTGVAVAEGDKGLSASCWTCKTPDAPRLMKQMGIEGYSGANFVDLGREIKSVVYCSDCHVDGSAELTLPRPYAQDAMAKIKLPFDKQDSTMQGAQVCGQCHVTYYFQPEKSNKVNIPWIFGSTADDIEKYYDTRRFYEWIHPISKTPILKARHPEFEHWSRSTHAKKGVTCITCHMPQVSDDKGQTFTDHKVAGAMDNFDKTCISCHSSKTALAKKLDNAKNDINERARNLELLLVKAHYEAKAAWDAGATWPQMNDSIMAIRHAQWRWDFAMASHGLYAHNPKEGVALLSVATEQITYGREALARILAQLSVTQVEYPDISTKQTAHAAIGFIEADAIKAKQAFIKDEVDKHWHPVAKTGY